MFGVEILGDEFICRCEARAVTAPIGLFWGGGKESDRVSNAV